MNASELKRKVEESGNEPYFFTYRTMRFFGDTMKNYGVRRAKINGKQVWELHRKHPVKHGLHESAYFDSVTFERVRG